MAGESGTKAPTLGTAAWAQEGEYWGVERGVGARAGGAPQRA